MHSEEELEALFQEAESFIDNLEQSVTDRDQRYSDSELIGSGAQKEVYRARDLWTGRSVALAFLKEGGAEGYFLREARILGGLQHPGIIPIYDFSSEGKPFFSMKLLTWMKETRDWAADPVKLKMLTDENDSVKKAGKGKFPKGGWRYLEYLKPE